MVPVSLPGPAWRSKDTNSRKGLRQPLGSKSTKNRRSHCPERCYIFAHDTSEELSELPMRGNFIFELFDQRNETQLCIHAYMLAQPVGD